MTASPPETISLPVLLERLHRQTDQLCALSLELQETLSPELMTLADPSARRAVQQIDRLHQIMRDVTGALRLAAQAAPEAGLQARQLRAALTLGETTALLTGCDGTAPLQDSGEVSLF